MDLAYLTYLKHNNLDCYEPEMCLQDNGFFKLDASMNPCCHDRVHGGLAQCAADAPAVHPMRQLYNVRELTTGHAPTLFGLKL